MHICFLTNEYPRPGHAHGGIGSFLQVHCPLLVKFGHQVSIIHGTDGPNRVEVQNGVQLYFVKFSNKSGIAWWINFRAINKALKELHHKSPIDIIEGSEMSFSFIEKIQGVKYLIRLHGGHHFFAKGEKREINRWKGIQERRSFSKADAFIGVSQYVIDHTSTYISFKDRPTKVIFNPIDLELFSGAEVEKIVPFNLVFVGTLVEKKGIRQLIQAFPSISRRFPKVTLSIYGRDWKDINGNSFRTKLEELIPIELKSKIRFFGPVDRDQLPGIYASAHICVFPSHIETLGLVAPEAMAMNRAVVFSNTGPGPEVIEHQVNGLLCNPHDPEDITKKVCELLDDQDKMSRIAHAGRQQALSKFDPSMLVRENVRFYESIRESK